jgi:hypothetical protein
MPLPERTLEQAREDLISCNRLAKGELNLSAARFSAEIGQEGGELTLEETYNWLGHFGLEALKAASNDAVSLTGRSEKAARSGLAVLARMLSLAPDAYTAYRQERGEPITVDAMGQALKNSAETPRRFMDVPNSVNKELEAAYNLRDYRSGFGSDYFRFEDTHRGPLFVADDTHFAQNYLPAENVGTDSLPDYWQRCPAKRLVTERIWPAMIDLAVQTPEVFPRHLEMAVKI